MEMKNAIRLLTEAFDAHEIKYKLFEAEHIQEVDVPFGIKNGPAVNVRFISASQQNDISVRIMNLVNKVPGEKHFSILEVCNALNNKFRFFRFVLDHDSDLHVEFDFPSNTGNDCLGEMAFEIFIRIMGVLNESYIMIARALYSSEEPSDEKNGADDAKKLFRLMKENPDEFNIIISKAKSAEDTI